MMRPNWPVEQKILRLRMALAAMLISLQVTGIYPLPLRLFLTLIGLGIGLTVLNGVATRQRWSGYLLLTWWLINW